MTATAERFNEIWAAEHRRVGQYVYWHMPDSARARAEDVTQEVFLSLWEHLQKGREVTHPFALLKRIAQRRIADQFAIMSRDVDAMLMDVMDTEAPTVETVGCCSRYASGEPELAMFAAELDTAMERMREASARWRDLHSATARYQARSRMYKDSAVCARWLAEAEKAAVLRDEALVELQEACRVVGDLRAELERAGGEGWPSSGGWPPSAARNGRHRWGALSDPTVRVCPERHCLADIESVTFLEDGTRVCRACSTSGTRRHRKQAVSS